eukprot:TRINITY_DN5077_c0_g1_i2.p1 TRINITY_DN5077_c0_g1~~TRINITY_DN5077_c0_g1_i2.p1  ORF type:complete len:1125 (+),score=159.56 TRINITY_DN5077_c0_g1_i2:74-3448(+)
MARPLTAGSEGVVLAAAASEHATSSAAVEPSSPTSPRTRSPTDDQHGPTKEGRAKRRSSTVSFAAHVAEVLNEGENPMRRSISVIDVSDVDGNSTTLSRDRSATKDSERTSEATRRSFLSFNSKSSSGAPRSNSFVSNNSGATLVLQLPVPEAVNEPSSSRKRPSTRSATMAALPTTATPTSPTSSLSPRTPQRIGRSHSSFAFVGSAKRLLDLTNASARGQRLEDEFSDLSPVSPGRRGSAVIGHYPPGSGRSPTRGDQSEPVSPLSPLSPFSPSIPARRSVGRGATRPSGLSIEGSPTRIGRWPPAIGSPASGSSSLPSDRYQQEARSSSPPTTATARSSVSAAPCLSGDSFTLQDLQNALVATMQRNGDCDSPVSPLSPKSPAHVFDQALSDAASARSPRSSQHSFRGKLSSDLFEASLSQSPRHTQPASERVLRSLDMSNFNFWVSWMLTAAIAIIVAVQSTSLLAAAKALEDYRLDTLSKALRSRGDGAAWPVFLALVAYSMGIVAVAAVLVVRFAVRAGGSAIVDIKAFVNGCHIPGLFSWSAWFARSLGMLLLASSGLAVGSEGLCLHLGTMTSLGLANAAYASLGDHLPAYGLRTKREYVLLGFAVGMAAAFEAPLAGFFFAIEDSRMYFCKTRAWRHAVACAMAVAAVHSGRQLLHATLHVPAERLVLFPHSTVEVQAWEFVAFIFIAIMGGLLGSVFCAAVKRLARLRGALYSLDLGRRGRSALRVLEAVALAAFSVVLCICIVVPSKCHSRSEEFYSSRTDASQTIGTLHSTVCAESDYSELGALLLSPREDTLQLLFTHSFDGGASFGVGNLLTASAVFLLLSVSVYGAAIPMGLFIPSLLIGGCMGRATGEAIPLFGGPSSTHLGLYGFLGAISVLAGVSRMTVSIMVLAWEMSGNTDLLLPIASVVPISKALADALTDSVFEIGFVLKSCDPDIVQGDLNEEDVQELGQLSVLHACGSSDLPSLRCLEAVSNIAATLMHNPSDVFALVSVTGSRLAGLITRQTIMTVLRDCDTSDGGAMVNLLMHADQTPDVKHWRTPLARAYQHFVACNLHYLCVVDEMHRPLGVLTRSDFARLSHHRTRDRAVNSLLARKEAEEGPQAHAPASRGRRD